MGRGSGRHRSSWHSNGWSEASLPPGEVIRVEGFAARDGSKQISGKSVVMTRTGRPVYVGTNGTPRPRPTASGPTPRWPTAARASVRRPGRPATGDIRAGAASSKTASTSRWIAYGLLNNIADAPKVAPMQPWALGLYQTPAEHVPRSAIRCSWRASRPEDRVSSSRSTDFSSSSSRTSSASSCCWAAATATAASSTPTAANRSARFRGTTTTRCSTARLSARWEGDTFVVDTRGFNEEFWFDNGGLPHTEQLQLIERFTRADMGTMRYEVTIDDPGAYTRQWKSSWNLNGFRAKRRRISFARTTGHEVWMHSSGRIPQ